MATPSPQVQRVGLELLGVGVASFSVSLYLGYSISKPKAFIKELDAENEKAGRPKTDPSIIAPERRKELFDEIASTWDNLTYWEEFFGRIKWYRRRLISTYATGRCLEVAAGTGANLSYYDQTNVTSLTLMDFSRPMLEIARKKFDHYFDRKEFDVRFRVGSAEKINFPDNTFDTVVDTFGICSFDDPSLAISEMTRVLKRDGMG